MTRPPFRNPWPDSEPHGWREVLRFLAGRRSGRRVPSPPRGSLPTSTPAIAYPRAGAADLTATWIGHSTVLLQLGGLTVITDPVFSQRAFPVQWTGPRRVMDPGLPLQALPPLDLVVLSHNHYDHLDRPAVKRISRTHPQATWVVPLGLGAYIRPWGARDIIELDWWEHAEAKGVRITATPARHFSGRGPRDRNRSLWCGFALEKDGRRALFAGDTAYHPAFGAIGSRCGPFELVMLPIGAYDPRWFMRVVHADPEEAVRIYQDLVAPHPDRPLPVMLGIHWGTFRLTDEPMDEPPRRTAECWRAAGLGESRLWIARFGETRRLAGGMMSHPEPWPRSGRPVLEGEAMNVRPAAPAEIDHLARVWYDGWQDAHALILPAELRRIRTLESFRDRLQAALADVRVAGPFPTPVGFCMLKGDELYQLYVSAEARGSGVAAALVADAEAGLAEAGVEVAWLACAIGNDRAARFYEKCGWQRAGVEVYHPDGANEAMTLEVVRYEKRLSPDLG